MKHTRNFSQFVNEAAGKGTGVAKKIADDTVDSYTYTFYGQADWAKIADYLYKHGFTVDAVKCIMMSKYMRWMGNIPKVASDAEHTHSYKDFVREFEAKIINDPKALKSLVSMIEEDKIEVYREEVKTAGPVDESKK